MNGLPPGLLSAKRIVVAMTARVSKGDATRVWPASLGPAAYHGLVGEYLRMVEPHTEGDPAAVLIQLLACAGNAMGRAPHFEVESTRHGTNLFVCVVGDTSAARKGTALDRARRIVQLADSDWAIANDGEGGLSTHEGLINAVRDQYGEGKDSDPGVSDKRLLAAMGEFAETLGKMKRQENPLSAVLRSAWDGRTLRNRTKVRPMVATGAHVSVIGHITEADLRPLLDKADIFNGFGNRFLWVLARRSKHLPFGGSLDDDALQPLAEKFVRALMWAEDTERVIDFDAASAKLWPRLYAELGASEAGPFGAITDRAEPQVRRVALIYAALDKSTRVKPVHLRAALEVWRYCEDSARYLFADAPEDRREARLLAIVNGEWVSKSVIHDQMKSVPSYQLASALDGLVERGVLDRRERPTKGRPRTDYRRARGK
jgi:hypothetical protein